MTQLDSLQLAVARGAQRGCRLLCHRPVVDRVLPITEVAEAHRVVEAGEHVGKVVLAVRA